MKEQAPRLRGWMRHHRLWSLIILLALLAGMGVVVNGTINLVRFGLPPPTGQNCGSIIHAYVPPEKTARADATLQSLACFWQAYQTCQAATISQTLAGTDVGQIDTLTIEFRNFRCVIYGHEEWQVNTKKGSGTYLCTRLSKDGDDLQVSACDGAESFTLYARFVTQEFYLCGVVNSTKPYAFRIPQEMEACFFTAYQQCLADSIEYFTSVQAVETEFNFYIDNHCGIAYSKGAKLAACASLELRNDGLHFLRCGTDGDIFMPNYSSEF